MGSSRRDVIKALGMVPLAMFLPGIARAGMPAFAELKEGYRRRLKRILASGHLPYIDIESSCNANKLDINALANRMDDLNIGLMAMSSDIGNGAFEKGVRDDHFSEKLIAAFPDYFIPVGNGGQGPALMEATDEFLDAQEQDILGKQIMLLGEYEFRHYPSSRQAKRGELDRDVSVPIDGPIGQRVFGMSEKTGVSVQIHYEVEDALLPPLESMLAKYPGAKVIWCHFTDIRYIERNTRYSPAYVDDLLRRFPNLHFDTAISPAGSIYPLSGQRQGRIWADDGSMRPEWLEVMTAHPSRFFSALDLGGDRIHRIDEYDGRHRIFLGCLPEDLRHQVAYRNAWRLLFGEEFS